ncbi:MAG TPA: hypothetical protein VEV41_18615 [Terriglobales bacterium]|nr:hypothetical protein [Terriglobales bacterium]
MLLTDVILPGKSGTDLAEILMQSRPEIRLLYTSGYTDDFVSQQEVLSRRTSLLEKPFSLESLLGKVREVLDAGSAREPARK